MVPAIMIFRLVLLTFSLHCLVAFRIFQKRIPNGDLVPFPCSPGKVWEGVGHCLNQGTGDRNPFGRDFEAAGKTWTVELCQTDSDGDSLTNGEELGDPNCVWTENDTPEISTYLSHPGICDPWDSPDCMRKPVPFSKYANQQEWMTNECERRGFVCPAVNDTGVRTIDLRLPSGTLVPATETTYECMIFNLTNQGLPANEDFHMVAVTPIVDNKNVLHHMVLSGCTDNTPPTDKPFPCGMLAAKSCMDYLHVWIVGMDGECYHPQCGVKIGLNGIKIVALQLHWNNPEGRTDLTDTSGVTLHLTPFLRPYDSGILIIGDSYFRLAPHHEELTVTSTCSSSCTKQLITGPVNVTSAWNHMHLTGRKMSIKVVRGGQVVKYLTNDKVYSYNSPQVQLYTEPFQLRPGDALISTCGYNTISRNKTTFCGEATQDEMCFGVLTFYPKQNVRDVYCVTTMGISYCDPPSMEGCPNMYSFIEQINNTTVFREVSITCRPFSPCLEECQETILRFMRSDKCMQGIVWKFIQEQLARKKMGKEFLSLLSSCKVEVYLSLNSAETPLQSNKKPPQSSEKPGIATKKPLGSSEETQTVAFKNCQGSFAQNGVATTPVLLAVAMATFRLYFE